MHATEAAEAHSFASTRLYDGASGAPVTISFALPVVNGILDPATANGIRVSIANLIAVGFSVNAPGTEPGEIIEEMAWFSRRRQINKDGRPDTPLIDIYLNNPTWFSRYTGIYLNTPEEITAFENATGLKLKDMPLYDDDKPAKRNDVRTGSYVIATATPVKVVVKDNPAYKGPDDKENKKRLFVRWANVVAAPAPESTAPALAVVPRTEAPAPNAPAASPPTPPTGSGSENAASTKGGWISPAAWIKTREEWDDYLASALAKFHMDADEVDNAHRRLSLCDKVGVGDWHKQRGWAIAALVACYCKYNADLISAYTSGLPAIDSVANLQLDKMAKLLVSACPEDAEDDPFTREFGGGSDPMGRKAIAAELQNKMVVITSIEKESTKRGHDMWIAYAPMNESIEALRSDEPIRISIYLEDKKKIEVAGYRVKWPSSPGEVTEGIAVAVTTKHNATTGWRIDDVLPPTMAMDEAAGM